MVSKLKDLKKEGAEASGGKGGSKGGIDGAPPDTAAQAAQSHKRGREDEDVMVVEEDEGEVEGVYDEDTGALSRPMKQFRGSGEARRRGFGVTPALDNHPFLHPQIMLIVGSSGKGKSTLAANIVDEIVTNIDRKKLGEVMWYSGSPGDPLLSKFDRSVVDVYGPSDVERLMSDLGDLNIRRKKDKTFYNGGARLPKEKRPLHVLVLDDANNNPDLTPQNAKGSEIGDYSVGHRHHNLVLIENTHKFNMLPTIARANASQIFAFPGSPAENQEVLKMTSLPQNILKRSLQDMARTPYDFLWLNLPQRAAMQNFSKVIVR